MSAISDLLGSADGLLVTTSFSGRPAAPEPPAPPRLTQWESLFLDWCPPVLAPARLVHKRAAREAWEGDEA